MDLAQIAETFAAFPRIEETIDHKIANLAWEAAYGYGDDPRGEARALVANLRPSEVARLRAVWVKSTSGAYADMADEIEAERAAERRNEEALSGAYWGPDWSDPSDVESYYSGYEDSFTEGLRALKSRRGVA